MDNCTEDEDKDVMTTMDPQGTLSKEFVDGGSLGLHRGKVFVVIVYPRPHGGVGTYRLWEAVVLYFTM